MLLLASIKVVVRLLLTKTMHELSIATSILEAVQKEAVARPGAVIVKVAVRIGELAGVDTDSLMFGWEAITKETEWEQVRLEIEACAWINRCSSCANEFRVTDYQTQCPKCGEHATKLVSGDELDIAYLEVEEDGIAVSGSGEKNVAADPS